MLLTVEQYIKELQKLEYDKKIIFLNTSDEEFFGKLIVKEKFENDDNDWYYSLKINKASTGCIKTKV